ncbi:MULTISPECIES: c-type cytochrome [unclassified Lentimonas]|uniref:c-type cytochrome n=1 Tax=unclassified Lentimonas TaxID=2630993 RepID=UPI00132C1362|nr:MULTISPECIES: c-type cytochrome [unclassified Lentimonas]CAA6679712.1 Cytochrome c4 [Lentimonas sp. CC4]CAA6683522.1 Cytochrome c4 [Lentimonas sp. CC6]CAA6693255.1 Cytochrome c4 [Lentimonas sp. CC10]CAA6695469.1 Cytochrome c4 [Lentimonas sp. CC19]CAA7071763.1 Cytochrome c4 [Lentimonas sp. CC11]
MNQQKDPQNRAPDESLCSLLVSFNFLFFTCLLAGMLILPLKSLFTGSGEAGHGDAEAEMHAAAGETEEIASAGKAAYMICSSCHGPDGAGIQAMNAPAIAGQEDWYLKRQIHKFKDGQRGTHAEDIYGMQMRPMAMILTDDAKIDEVVEYIASLPAPHPEPTLDGDAAKGKAAYMLCQACHAPDGKGNKLMNAPGLTGLPDWYIVTQLKNYKAGIRGAHPKDIEGMQMAPMAKTIADEQAMKDLAAYINSLGAAK